MKPRILLSIAGLLLLIWAATAQRAAIDAVEISPANLNLMPTGKEADGIPGDFILRNDRIHALISGGQPLRRANMTTEYGYVLQGILYDLDARDAGNDQITAFRPAGEQGEMSWVRQTTASSIEAVRTAAKGGGLYTRHEYLLENGWNHIAVVSTFRNESASPRKITPAPVWKGLGTEWRAGPIVVGDSIDPADKRAYAYRDLDKEVTLQPREEKAFRGELAVGTSPLQAYGIIAALSGPTGQLAGSVNDAAGGSLLVTVQGQKIPLYPDTQGRLASALPPGTYTAVFEDIGRDPVTQTFTIEAGKSTALKLSLPPASLVKVHIRDEEGNPLPGRVQFLGVEGTATPNFGTEYRAHGSDHQYRTHDGEVAQQVPPGKYLLRVTRGPEYELAEHTITVGKGQAVELTTRLTRSVDTKGWISTDYHAHSTPSGDNYCNTRDRLINFASEQLEFVPTTEHNRIYDWAPLISSMGLDRHMKTVTGIELTGSGQHFNAFPMVRDPLAQNGGAPLWHIDPRITAIALRNWGAPTRELGGSRYDSEANARNKVPYFGGGPDRWVQANHPIVGNVFFDRDADGVQDGGFAGFESLIDAAEVWSTEILNLNPVYKGFGVAGSTANRGLPNRTFGWLQMLNQGRRMWCVAVSDAHRIFGNGVGSWRTYVSSSTDDPARIDYKEIIANSKAGRMVISNGPFLEVSTSDGLPVGSTVIREGSITLKVRVQAPRWMEVDRVQILVNGQQPKSLQFTRGSHPAMFRDAVVRFEQNIGIPLQQDAHLIVVATSDSANLEKGWGRDGYANMRPLAYTNPIFVDVDRNGFQHNGDTLGYALVTGIVSVQ
jgi:hypothetical protein